MKNWKMHSNRMLHKWLKIETSEVDGPVGKCNGVEVIEGFTLNPRDKQKEVERSASLKDLLKPKASRGVLLSGNFDPLEMSIWGHFKWGYGVRRLAWRTAWTSCCSLCYLLASHVLCCQLQLLVNLFGKCTLAIQVSKNGKLVSRENY